MVIINQSNNNNGRSSNKDNDNIDDEGNYKKHSDGKNDTMNNDTDMHKDCNKTVDNNKVKKKTIQKNFTLIHVRRLTLSFMLCTSNRKCIHIIIA